MSKQTLAISHSILTHTHPYTHMHLAQVATITTGKSFWVLAASKGRTVLPRPIPFH